MSLVFISFLPFSDWKAFTVKQLQGRNELANVCIGLEYQMLI